MLSHSRTPSPFKVPRDKTRTGPRLADSFGLATPRWEVILLAGRDTYQQSPAYERVSYQPFLHEVARNYEASRL
jgi:hypothetical protein